MRRSLSPAVFLLVTPLLAATAHADAPQNQANAPQVHASSSGPDAKPEKSTGKNYNGLPANGAASGAAARNRGQLRAGHGPGEGHTDGEVHTDGDGHDHGDEVPGETQKPFGGSASNLDYLWARSDKAFHDGDYERAIGLHRAIVALDPSDTESYGVAAWLLWSLGRGDEAIAHLKRGIAVNPRNSDIWVEAGENYNLQKKFPEATDAFRHAVEYAPPGSDTHMVRRFLGHAAEKSGNLTLSIETWQGLVRDFPDDAVNKNNLARVQKIAAGEAPANITEANAASAEPASAAEGAGGS